MGEITEFPSPVRTFDVDLISEVEQYKQQLIDNAIAQQQAVNKQVEQVNYLAKFLRNVSLQCPACRGQDQGCSLCGGQGVARPVAIKAIFTMPVKKDVGDGPSDYEPPVES
jgi:hypothetical protein